MTILYLQTSISAINLQELSGVREYARKAGWHVVVRPISGAASQRLAGMSMYGHCSVRELVRSVKPDGVIVEGGSLSEAIRRNDFCGVPTVFMDRVNGRMSKDVPCVRSDPKSVAAAAFGELSKLGFNDYAYVPWFERLEWSVERGRVFAEMVKTSGASFHPFRDQQGMKSEPDFSSRIGRFLENLPQPCAVFAANDVIGECVLHNLRMMRARIPDMFAVVGVDNDVGICEFAQPSLTSIVLDFRQAGFLAAECLAKLLIGKKVTQHPRFGVLQTVRRSSTRIFRRTDLRVSAIVEYVRKNACTGIGVAEVVGKMGCSRRLAELRVREVTGKSILTLIREVRRGNAERLLSGTTHRLSEIAVLCGYDNEESFSKDFVRQTGRSPRDWRKQSRT